MSSESDSEDEEEEPISQDSHEISCCLALKYYLCCLCCCSHQIAPEPVRDEIQSIGSGSISEAVDDKKIRRTAEQEYEEQHRKKRSRFKFRVAGKIGRYAAIEEAKQAAAEMNKRRFKSAGKIARMIASSSAAASQVNVQQSKGRKSFKDIGKMAQLGVKTTKKGKKDESSDSSSEESSDGETVPKKKGWGMKSIGKMGFFRSSSPEKKKRKARKSFQAVGKMTQLGIKSSKKPANDESSDESASEEEAPKKKGWGMKSVGKMGFFRQSSPQKKKSKARKSFKSVGKMTQLGVKTSKTSANDESSDESSEEEKAPKKKGWGMKSVGKMGFFRGASPEKKKRRKSFKDVGKLTKVGVQASRKDKKKKKMDSIEETMVEEIMSGKDFGYEEDIIQEVKRRRTLKSVGQIIKLGGAARKKRRKTTTFKSLANFIRYGTRKAPKKSGDSSDSSEDSPSPVKKRKSFKVVGKLARLGFGKRNIARNEDDDDEDEEERRRRKKKKKGWTFRSLGVFTRMSSKKPVKKKKKTLKVLSRQVSKVTRLGAVLGQSFKRKPTTPTERKKPTLKSVAKVSMLGAIVSRFSKPKKKWTFKKVGKAAKIGAAVQLAARLSKPKKKKKFTLKFLSRFIGFTQDDRNPVCSCDRTSNGSDIMICTCSDYFETDEE